VGPPESFGDGADHPGADRRAFLRSGLLLTAAERSRDSSSSPIGRWIVWLLLGCTGSYGFRIEIGDATTMLSSDIDILRCMSGEDAMARGYAAMLPLALREEVGRAEPWREDVGGLESGWCCIRGETLTLGDRSGAVWASGVL